MNRAILLSTQNRRHHRRRLSRSWGHRHLGHYARGAQIRRQQEHSAGKNREALDQFISPLEVSPFDRQATAAYGKLRATLEKKGQSIGSMDLLIAAHALSLGVRLITHNVREFGRVPGLRFEDWA